MQAFHQRRRLLLPVLLIAVVVSGALPSAVAAVRGPALEPVTGGNPVRPCASLTEVSIVDETDDVQFTVDGAVETPASGTTPATCRVALSATHPPAGDDVNIWVWLPVDTWNGRFQGTGGGGFSGGSENSLAGPVRSGYAAGSTDTGHVGGSGSFALNPDRSLNWQLIQDNAYLGIHEMTVAGKALTEAYYGKPAHYSYFNGCSTGGRQGLSEAQRYPLDYDGILSGAPAINWQKLHPAQSWGQVAMLEADHVVEPCKLSAAVTAAVQACDRIDGVADNVIGDPTRCDFDPAELVGTTTPCGEFSTADAAILQRIWDGPRTTDGDFLWHGQPRGASLAALNGSTVVGGERVGAPFGISLEWFRYFLLQNPQWDWRTMDHDRYEQLFVQSVQQYTEVIGTDNPDLSEFREAGGKIVLWHGWTDPLITAHGTVDYYERVQEETGGKLKTEEFARLFMAPGVDHCGGGAGASPVDPLAAVVRWVEEGEAPRTLPAARTAGGTTVTRPLCMYPLVASYTGRGSVNDAANFRCMKDYRPS